MILFSAKNISAGYNGSDVITDISFDLEKGSLIGILGANGSGKTTLLKSISCILPHKGECELSIFHLEALSPREIAKKCSYIPQRSGISIDISVLDTVLMGFNPHLGLLEHPDSRMKEKALNALSRVGLAAFASENLLYLSEGQKQLVFLARAVVADSSLLILDEPDNALDFRHRYHVLDILKSYVKNKECSALLTLHDPSLALNYCDKLLLLSEKKIIGEIFPKKDSADKMEELLKKIYGSISLHLVKTRDGSTQYVMIKETDI